MSDNITNPVAAIPDFDPMEDVTSAIALYYKKALVVNANTHTDTDELCEVILQRRPLWEYQRYTTLDDAGLADYYSPLYADLTVATAADCNLTQSHDYIRWLRSSLLSACLVDRETSVQNAGPKGASHLLIQIPEGLVLFTVDMIKKIVKGACAYADNGDIWNPNDLGCGGFTFPRAFPPRTYKAECFPLGTAPDKPDGRPGTNYEGWALMAVRITGAKTDGIIMGEFEQTLIAETEFIARPLDLVMGPKPYQVGIQGHSQNQPLRKHTILNQLAEAHRIATDPHPTINEDVHKHAISLSAAKRVGKQLARLYAEEDVTRGVHGFCGYSERMHECQKHVIEGRATRSQILEKMKEGPPYCAASFLWRTRRVNNRIAYTGVRK